MKTPPSAVRVLLVDGQADNAGGWLGEQQHQAGGHAGTQGGGGRR